MFANLKRLPSPPLPLHLLVPPALKPLIYSVRNQELKDVVLKLMNFLTNFKLPIFI